MDFRGMFQKSEHETRKKVRILFFRKTFIYKIQYMNNLNQFQLPRQSFQRNQMNNVKQFFCWYRKSKMKKKREKFDDANNNSIGCTFIRRFNWKVLITIFFTLRSWSISILTLRKLALDQFSFWIIYYKNWLKESFLKVRTEIDPFFRVIKIVTQAQHSIL